MPRITPERREQQRERIIQATRAVALRKGLAGLAMSDVIAESGLSAGAIYGYFSGREELIAAMARTIIGGRVERLEALAAQRPVLPPLEGLEAFLRSVPEDIVVSGLVLQIWGEGGARPELLSEAVAVAEAMESALRDYLEAWLAHGRGLPGAQAQELAAAAAPGLLALTQGFVARSTLRRSLDIDAFLHSARALLVALEEPPAAAAPTGRGSSCPQPVRREAAGQSRCGQPPHPGSTGPSTGSCTA